MIFPITERGRFIPQHHIADTKSLVERSKLSSSHGN